MFQINWNGAEGKTMPDIAAHEINKYYGANHVLKGVSFEIHEGEKIGLLGKNGSGKTTLFKVITGEEPFESGELTLAKKKIEMLAQIPVFDGGETTEDVLRSSFNEISEIYSVMKKLEGDGSPQALKKYGRLLEEYERLGGYETETKLEKVCAGMSIGSGVRQNLFSELSGGEKTRVNLARILLRDCDVLLLDEPTNHLDIPSLEWLEKFLRDFSGTVVTVSHDRVFLDRVVTRIIEIEQGKANHYKGNYSYYAEESKRRLLSRAELYERQQKEIRRLEAAAKRMHEWARQADNEALHKRAFSIEKRIERMDKTEKPTAERRLTAEFGDGGYAAKEIVSFKDICKRYENIGVINNLNIKIYRNERIALVGANGCGKTTLMKLMLGEVPQSGGEIKMSVNVKPGYLPQIVNFGDPMKTVLEILRDETDYTNEKARSVLAGFNFRADEAAKKAGSLSGGEKSRLKLCLLMQSNVNFLLLDEPTNHLDIASREWIENAIADFEGTMLFVSHDRFFLNRFAEKIWSMENGAINSYCCGYEEYIELSRPVPAAEKNNRARKKK
ncbi:MAG: ABC-F type ribosomal protection protein [Defluviitaleaceae bacterium]|nr:ABC-F type ribosomal protection protein [Defluviitaleaceae bacterium]